MSGISGVATLTSARVFGIKLYFSRMYAVRESAMIADTRGFAVVLRRAMGGKPWDVSNPSCPVYAILDCDGILP